MLQKIIWNAKTMELLIFKKFKLKYILVAHGSTITLCIDFFQVQYKSVRESQSIIKLAPSSV